MKTFAPWSLLSPKIAHSNIDNVWKNNQHIYNILPTFTESNLTRWPKLCRKPIKLCALPKMLARAHLCGPKQLQNHMVCGLRECTWRNSHKCGNNTFMNLVRPQPLLGWCNSRQDPKINPKSHLGMTEKMGCTSKSFPFTHGVSYQIPCYGSINRGPLYAQMEEIHIIVMFSNYSWRSHFFF